ncbi:MAG: hypothetical protein MO847_00460 [Candidatus Protistobacter heckmanni]|nr:hypothetical protein [Candidatus Protistobacter heckmanni]
MQVGPNTNTLTDMNQYRASMTGMQTYTRAYSFESMDPIVYWKPSAPSGDNPVGPAAIVEMSQKAQTLLKG